MNDKDLVIDDNYIKRKVRISTYGWIAAIFSGLFLYWFAFNLIKSYAAFQQLIKSDQFQNFSELNVGFFDIGTWSYIILGSAFFLGVFMLISSIAVIRYRNWGRKVFVITSWIMIIIGLLLVILYILNANEIMDEYLKSSSPVLYESGSFGIMIKNNYHYNFIGYGILLILVMRSSLQLIKLFRSKDYKPLFY